MSPIPLPRELLVDDRTARMAWSRLAEPGDPVMTGLIAQLGAVDALAAIAETDDRRFRGIQDRAASTDLTALPRAAAVLGARIIVPGDDDWPTGLDDLLHPPPCLWAIGAGEPAGLRDRGVSIVGARTCSRYGASVAHDLAAGLAAHGRAIVSGAAFGIDRAAHDGALAASGRTIAVLAGGLDRCYPSQHAGLIRAIAESCVVLSEVPPGGAPTRYRFLQRNRLIAALTAGTVIVEAGLRSGSLNTAKHAREVGRPIGAVPGPVTSAVSAGCHNGVREGWATLVTDVAEVIDLVGRIGVDAAPRRRAAVRPADEVSEGDRLVLAVVPVRAPAEAQRIALHAGLPFPETLAALGRLAVAGLVARHGTRWKQVVQPRDEEPRERPSVTRLAEDELRSEG
ncbi:MAG TPA: DNA-processing protein DprA [Dermatophilaceae bacterium]|nr:DNA-processing protein DprA [Dermatophilaceae bacterium]